VLSNQDFGVLQFFRVDDFQADDPSPSHYMLYHLTFIIVCLLKLDKMFQNVIVEFKFSINVFTFSSKHFSCVSTNFFVCDTKCLNLHLVSFLPNNVIKSYFVQYLIYIFFETCNNYVKNKVRTATQPMQLKTLDVPQSLYNDWYVRVDSFQQKSFVKVQHLNFQRSDNQIVF